MPRKMLLILAVLASAMFAFAACGDDEEDSADDAAEPAATTDTGGEGASGGDDASADGEGGTVAIEADPGGGLSYTTGDVSTSAGEVTIEFTNESPTPHDVLVEGDSGELGGTEVISGDTTTATVELKPGTYTYYCSVDGHREAGMEETLTAE